MFLYFLRLSFEFIGGLLPHNQKTQIMSHFIVNLIIHEDRVNKRTIEKMLAPYDENCAVEPYIVHRKNDAAKLHTEELNRLKGILDRKDAKYNIDVFKRRYEKIRKMTDLQYYHYYFDRAKKDKEGNILSTYNPNSKWDWWQIGGRFAGWLNPNADKLRSKIKANSCPTEYAIEQKKIPFAFVTPDGKWTEQGNMGWFAIVKNEIPKQEWEKMVIVCYRKYPGHTVVQIDCHI